MKFFKSKKCEQCDKKLKKDEETGELRIDTNEGILTMEICLECSDFFDKSAEVLQNRRRDDKQSI